MKVFTSAIVLILHAVGAVADVDSSNGGMRKLSGDSCIIEDGLDTLQTLILPDDPSYEEKRSQWASEMASSSISDMRTRPQAIAFCQNEADVVSVVSFARRCSYKLSVRSGGHQYAGYSSCEEGTQCIQIDVSGIKTFEHQEGTTSVVMGVGLKLEEAVPLLAAIANPGPLVIPMGICNSIGLGGHFQSSAMGVFGRSFGSGMDLIKSFRIVTADGEVLTVTDQSHPDLYWAVLGGSPGSWGVVLEYTFDAIFSLEYLKSNFFVYSWNWDADLFVQLGSKFLEISAAEDTAKDLFITLNVGTTDEIREAFKDTEFAPQLITAIGVWTGIESGEPLPGDKFERYVQPFLDIEQPVGAFDPSVLGLTPNEQGVAPWIPLHVAPLVLRFNFDFNKWRYHVQNMITKDFMDDTFLEQLAAEIDERLNIPFLRSTTNFQPYGGAGSGSQFNQNAGQNAYPLRDMKIHLDDWIFFKNDDQEASLRSRMERFRDETKKTWKNQGLGFERNWMNTDTITASSATLEKDWKDYYPSPAWYRRLRDAKLQVDPCNVFSNNMTIPVKKHEIKANCLELV